MPPFTPTNPENGFHYGAGEPASGMRSADYDRFAERLELRYDGIANWLSMRRANGKKNGATWMSRTRTKKCR